MTKFINLYNHKDINIADSPGSNDKEGAVDLATHVSTINGIQSSNSVRPVLVLSRHDIEANRGKNFSDLLDHLAHMIPEDLATNMQSMTVVFTNMDPEHSLSKQYADIERFITLQLNHEEMDDPSSMRYTLINRIFVGAKAKLNLLENNIQSLDSNIIHIADPLKPNDRDSLLSIILSKPGITNPKEVIKFNISPASQTYIDSVASKIQSTIKDSLSSKDFESLKKMLDLFWQLNSILGLNNLDTSYNSTIDDIKQHLKQLVQSTKDSLIVGLRLGNNINHLQLKSLIDNITRIRIQVGGQLSNVETHEQFLESLIQIVTECLLSLKDISVYSSIKSQLDKFYQLTLLDPCFQPMLDAAKQTIAERARSLLEEVKNDLDNLKLEDIVTVLTICDGIKNKKGNIMTLSQIKNLNDPIEVTEPKEELAIFESSRNTKPETKECFCQICRVDQASMSDSIQKGRWDTFKREYETMNLLRTCNHFPSAPLILPAIEMELKHTFYLSVNTIKSQLEEDKYEQVASVAKRIINARGINIISSIIGDELFSDLIDDINNTIDNFIKRMVNHLSVNNLNEFAIQQQLLNHLHNLPHSKTDLHFMISQLNIDFKSRLDHLIDDVVGFLKLGNYEQVNRIVCGFPTGTPVHTELISKIIAFLSTLESNLYDRALSLDIPLDNDKTDINFSKNLLSFYKASILADLLSVKFQYDITSKIKEIQDTLLKSIKSLCERQKDSIKDHNFTEACSISNRVDEIVNRITGHSHKVIEIELGKKLILSKQIISNSLNNLNIDSLFAEDKNILESIKQATKIDNSCSAKFKQLEDTYIRKLSTRAESIQEQIDNGHSFDAMIKKNEDLDNSVTTQDNVLHNQQALHG
ncbi:hypothetical protein SAMD00019534_001190 [Acytostelium subglobosum LB1]|uniref:hypothetical protein n=1 Tax=Acytostelium subglobosum LB1 TaxID=1410327 RepID=UPI000644B691|nr:hypothetical protein SAMD00019534_001190 [Acytostelium subglobosum LB1]GAM16944.1 hypothetical protein SAMD00019534_001190 [Acytostelium subglobosum LB1]|eukprot:XP_012759006.1 hypothetical protein SAMD00019534_001190 [Acytostelium subglobosum LB1]